MHSRMDTFRLLKMFIVHVKTQFEVTIKCVRSDNETEFTIHQVTKYLNSLGIQY